MIDTLGMPAPVKFVHGKGTVFFRVYVTPYNLQILKIFLENDCHIKEELFTMNER